MTYLYLLRYPSLNLRWYRLTPQVSQFVPIPYILSLFLVVLGKVMDSGLYPDLYGPICPKYGNLSHLR